MYNTYYALDKKPFEISPDPEFLWLGDNYKEALAHLKYGILESKGFLLITGDIGTGKTTLIRRLVKLIEVAAIVVTIPDPDMKKLDFFNFLGNELNMARTFNSKGEFLIYFKQFMLSVYRTHKKVLLIIDEAQRLNHELLQEICILSNLDFEGQMLLNVFFVGQTEFNTILMDDRNQSVRNKIVLSYHLDPLKKEEVSSYIHHRLQVAGRSEKVFTPGAISKIFSFSNGYPRLINIICDRALLTAYTNGMDRVDAAVVKECGKELAITIGNYRTKKPKAPARHVVEKKPHADRPRVAAAISVPIAVTMLMFLGFIVYQLIDSFFSISPSLTSSAPEIQASYRSLESIREEKLNANNDQAQMDLESRNIFEPENQGDRSQDELSSLQASLNEDQKDRFVVYYKHDSNDIQPSAIKKLNHISNIFYKSPPSVLTIRGFTDSQGNVNYNQYISVERANEVKKYLVKQGIPAAKIKVIGMGSKEPGSLDMTLEKRRENRRVEIEISDDKEQTP